MTGKTFSQAEIRRAGLEALAHALGPVGMARFLQQFDPGSGDYSEDRHALLGGADLATLAAEIRSRRPSSGEL